MLDTVVYKGLGFPILIQCPEYKKVGKHERVLQVNHVRLMRAVYSWLVTKPGRLSGAELKFIRTYLDKTQKEFAEFALQAGHSIIAKWEAKGPKPTGMEPQTEHFIRVQMVLCLGGRIENEMVIKIAAAIRTNKVGERFVEKAAA
jgi:DNA-binding transcriptional regulator YiaG